MAVDIDLAECFTSLGLLELGSNPERLLQGYPYCHGPIAQLNTADIVLAVALARLPQDHEGLFVGRGGLGSASACARGGRGAGA